MEFIGNTALIDAVIVVLSWVVLFSRQPKTEGGTGKVKYLSQYFVATFAFLVLIAFTILKTEGVTQQVMFLVSDLVLWVSLFIFILLMYADTKGTGKGLMMFVFGIFALCRSLFQLAGIVGMDLTGLGDTTLYVLQNLDAWLMYAVWVPSALVLIYVALTSESNVVRFRSLVFAIGLLLISFTWAFRLLSAATVSVQTAYLLVGGLSVLGFILLLAGILYKGQNTGNSQMTMNTPSTPSMQ
ncbi:MAG: hypothetical protein KBD14_02080 [Candidatus Pacebacteria bacterium]|nr:hypothetical protein [Candidatus Paceibacterota bacterium]